MECLFLNKRRILGTRPRAFHGPSCTSKLEGRNGKHGSLRIDVNELFVEPIIIIINNFSKYSN